MMMMINLREEKITVEDKNKKMSAFAKKRQVESALMARELLLVLMYKDVYFTKDLKSSFPCDVVSLLQEFIDVFPKQVKYENTCRIANIH